MRPQGPVRPASTDKEPRLESGEANGFGRIFPAPQDSAARPFVERRRHAPKSRSWHEALEPVHRLLVRYEQANQLLAEAEESYRSIFENALIGIFRVGPDGELLIVNPSMARICGYDSPQQMLAEVRHFGEQVIAEPEQWNELLCQLLTTESQYGVEVEACVRGGARIWIELNIRTVPDGEAALYYECTAANITDRKIAEERIRLLAYYDLVTGLPNRPLFEERFEEALSAAQWKSSRVALLVLELGRFKMINDSLGRAFADRLLKEVAARIRAAVGEERTVARIGGAEFAILLEDVAATHEVEQIAGQVIAAMAGEFSSLGNSIGMTCTMGISMFPLHGWDGHSLIERADVAMCSAREHGANEFRFFTEEMNQQIRARLVLENGLRMALERDELFLVYQPQVDLRTGNITGLEALLRWQHPEKGLVPPSEFISIAESSGLIVPIGEWVLRTACLQARNWQDSGLPAVPIAVNVSAVQIRRQGFCSAVRRILEDTGLDAKYLELELTEGVLLTTDEVLCLHIQELREMGVKLAIDDFGTGYSSLGYLRQFKVNRLKIDRSFVREVSVNADDAAITTAIINMAKALNLDVLAEGVENAEQLDFLREQNCFEIQGFYFSKPVTADQIAGQLQAPYKH